MNNILLTRLFFHNIIYYKYEIKCCIIGGKKMANIIEYVKWRGDLTIDQSRFNEIDSLILNRFSYFPFDDIIEENEIVTIKDLSKRFMKKDMNTMHILWDDDANLFPAMGDSTRFGEMKATMFVNKISAEQEKQFSAITILLPDDTIYVSYRGTDNTVVGWKEDLNMTFKSHVPSQIDAVKYLENVGEKYKQCNIRLGGHSKGGNLAVYAAVFANNDIQNKIIDVYNDDGPGFNDNIVNSPEYKKMISKVNTYIPQDSIFGRLLTHEENYKVVRSTQKGVMQHDIYSWQLFGNKLECLKEVTNGSKFIDKSITDWLSQIDMNTREQVIDIVFQVINTTKVETMAELKKHWFLNAKTVFSSYKQISPENKKMIMETLSALFKIVKDNLIEERKN
mgnify:FL=1